ncbi:MAG TPA: hypothetical protein VK671_15160 [Mucilaginibacter sp.]|jgi:hypothetical protein|nr:hypothetical protein [Mucilaginibacter sp.]
MSIALVLVYVSVISGFLPVFAALYNYRQLSPVLKIMALFCLLSVISDTISLVTAYILRLTFNTPFVMHLFDMMAVVFFTLIYFKAFYAPVLKKITLILGTVTVLIMLFNCIFIEGIRVYPSISNTALSMFLIVLSLTYFFQLLSRQEFMYIEKQGLFWINSGVLFYYSITIFLFMLFNKISGEHKIYYYMTQSITNIIANLLYSVGLLCKPQKTT